MDYVLMFTQDQYEELIKLYEKNKSFYLCTLIKSLEKDPENMWTGEVSRVQFILAMLIIQNINRNSFLLDRMIELGELQDREFKIELAFYKREAYKYMLQ